MTVGMRAPLIFERTKKKLEGTSFHFYDKRKEDINDDDNFDSFGGKLYRCPI